MGPTITVTGLTKNARGRAIIQEASHELYAVDQCLFLVADVNNPFDKEAVLLHDGLAKLGVVRGDKAKLVRGYLNHQSTKLGYDVVLVVSSPPLGKEFLGFTSLNVHIEGYVYERYARKYAAIVRSKEN